MTIQEAIEARHSVRAYKEEPLTQDVVKVLEEKIAELNRKGNLHMQLILNEPKAFQGTLAKYGKFRGVSNYIVVAGKKADDMDERVGYYGEHLVLFALTLGLNTCWVGLSYSKVPGTYVLELAEKIDSLLNHALTEDENLLLRQTLGMGCKQRSIKDLARQMGTTQKAVQQQLVEIVEKLRHHDDSIQLWKYLNR